MRVGFALTLSPFGLRAGGGGAIARRGLNGPFGFDTDVSKPPAREFITVHVLYLFLTFSLPYATSPAPLINKQGRWYRRLAGWWGGVLNVIGV